jgi:hypothetical protein
MGKQKRSSRQNHAFVVRIWWEQGLTRPDGGLLWRGQIQHAGSGRERGFQSLGEMVHFIQDLTGELEESECMQHDMPVRKEAN